MTKIDWPTARPILTAERDRQQLTDYKLAVASGLPMTTVYNAMRPEAQTIYLATLNGLLHALGKSWPWLIREIDSRSPPHPPESAKPCKTAKPPAKKKAPAR